jgi:hypothetical protein
MQTYGKLYMHISSRSILSLYFFGTNTHPFIDLAGMVAHQMPKCRQEMIETEVYHF